ncbi:MAG: serine hydrolase domain-containing protein [Myxococcota bacterium]
MREAIPRKEISKLLFRQRIAAALLLAAALGSLGCGGEAPSEAEIDALGIPEAEGERKLSSIRRLAINRLLDFRVASGARAGFVALVAQDGQLAYARTTGYAEIESKTPMRLSTPFQLASMTKPVTAVAAMILIEEGRLSLEDPVSNFIPEFAEMRVAASPASPALGAGITKPLAEPIRVRHLLTFTSGIGGYAETEDPFDLHWRSPDIEAAGLGSLAERIELIPRLPLYEQPGQKWRYGWSFDVLARVIEIAAEEPFDRFLERRIFTPLGMQATMFPDDLPPTAPVARMYTHDEDGRLVREPRFDADYGHGWTPGGGGLVSTAPDYLRFALMLAQGGSLDGTRILKSETVAEMTRLHVPSGVLADMELEGLGWGLGFSVVADAEKTPMPAKNGDYWWNGRFGTHFWISPETNTVTIVLQQTERSAFSDLPYTASVVQALATP